MRQLEELLGDAFDAEADPIVRALVKKELRRETLSMADQEAVRGSKWYRQLLAEQDENGSWGRFHTMDARLRGLKFVTTEAALRRARELGLTKDDPMLARTIGLMERYLRGEAAWPDPTEKHHDAGKSFLTSFPFLIAANLCRFDPENSLVQPFRACCAQQLARAFSGGAFEDSLWQQANRDYTGTCLQAWMVYPAWLLQSAPGLTETLQRRYFRFLWHRENGIYYISNAAPAKICRLEEKGFLPWLSALEALSGFSLFPEFMQGEAAPHLLHEIHRLIHDEVHLPPAHPIAGHYAERWRTPNARKRDLILRILRLLACFEEGSRDCANQAPPSSNPVPR